MPIALTVKETFEYQLIDDRLPNPDGQRNADSAVDPNGTVFEFRPLAMQDEADLQDKIFTEGGKLKIGTHWLLRLQRGVKGWRNFRDAAGNQVAFSFGNMERLSIKHRIELAEAHFRRYSLTADEGN